MDFSKKEDRKKYLEEKFDNLLDVIGDTYGNVLMEELVTRLDVTIDEFDQEMSSLFKTLKDKEVERQSYLKDIDKGSKTKSKPKAKSKTKDKKLSEWEEKLEKLEKSK